MFLRLAIALSILFIFFIELNINKFVSSYHSQFEYNMEMDVRNQSWRNLEMVEHSIRSELKNHKESHPVTRDIVLKMIDDHGQSYIGSNTGTLFAIDLEKNSLVYSNNIDFNKMRTNKPFGKDCLYKLTKEKGGDIESVKHAWVDNLIYKSDNIPADRLSWNVTGEEKWLVCKTLPSTNLGFNDHKSALEPAFQVKICQTAERHDILQKYNPLFQDLEEHKDFIVNLIRIIVGIFLLSVLMDFTIRRYKYKNGQDRRKFSPGTCELCSGKSRCNIDDRPRKENENSRNK